MGLIHLDILGFRNLINVNLKPTPCGFNFIYGKNGSGKTSLLEAIHYLSLGRSFRSTITERIIHHSASKMAIFAHMRTHSEQFIPVGIERGCKGEAKIRVNGKDVHSIAELVNLVPVQLINSMCHNLLDAGPAFRRKYLDWCAFYLNNDFLRLWRQFERALKQRNAALRHRLSRKELDVWTLELIEHGLQLDQLRREAVEQLIPLIEQALVKLLMTPNLKMHYQPGWDSTHSYQDALLRSIDRDFQMGHTQIGPHKADLKIVINGAPAKDILSRGQQKLFVCAMITARGTLLKSRVNQRPIYLIDDLPSELDATSRANLIALLSQQEAQVFVTAIERESGDEILTHCPKKLFHVEHGNVTAE